MYLVNGFVHGLYKIYVATVAISYLVSYMAVPLSRFCLISAVYLSQKRAVLRLNFMLRSLMQSTSASCWNSLRLLYFDLLSILHVCAHSLINSQLCVGMQLYLCDYIGQQISTTYIASSYTAYVHIHCKNIDAKLNLAIGEINCVLPNFNFNPPTFNVYHTHAHI